jgi:prepilin-type N-terminal cleavage/methylation domain-containing protein
MILQTEGVPGSPLMWCGDYVGRQTARSYRLSVTLRPAVTGFTLIELLVVVAIIALLISILLPSLAKARGQARTSLCASRVSQLTKGMLMYADDFGETPPFIDPGFDRADPNESWLAEPNQMQIVLDPTKDEAAWDVAGVRLPQSGRLFAYTRFAELYRCPEFERISDSRMMQHRFNYTRSLTGRRWRAPPMLGGNANNPLFGDFRGPVMKVSGVYAPSVLIMMVDEQWNRHVAADYQYSSDPGDDFPMRADPVWFLADEMGQYHGQEVKEQTEYVGSCKRAGLTYWDGHATHPAVAPGPFPGRVLSAHACG